MNGHDVRFYAGADSMYAECKPCGWRVWVDDGHTAAGLARLAAGHSGPASGPDTSCPDCHVPAGAEHTGMCGARDSGQVIWPGMCGSCRKNPVANPDPPSPAFPGSLRASMRGQFCGECIGRCNDPGIADHVCAIDRWAEEQGQAAADLALQDAPDPSGHGHGAGVVGCPECEELDEPGPDDYGPEWLDVAAGADPLAIPPNRIGTGDSGAGRYQRAAQEASGIPHSSEAAAHVKGGKPCWCGGQPAYGIPHRDRPAPQECAGCTGRGTGTACCVCGLPIPAALRRRPGDPSEIGGPSRAATAELAARLARQGRDDPAIADRLGITAGQVRGLRKEYDIPPGETRWRPGGPPGTGGGAR